MEERPVGWDVRIFERPCESNVGWLRTKEARNVRGEKRRAARPHLFAAPSSWQP